MTRRRLLTLLAAAAVVVAAVAAWRWRAGEGEPSLKIESAKVDRGRIVAKVTATGTLSAIVTVQVGSQVSGRVAALHADFNSQVKKGQLIAKIDPQLFQAAVEQARANSVAAQANLAKSKAQAADADRQYQRAKALAERKLIAQADLDTAQSNADAARAQVDASAGAVAQARAALHQAEVNLAYTDITSPTNGVVISRNVDVGQTVAASLQAPTLFVIAEDLAKMQVDTSVAEADVGRLSAGMTATFTVDAYPSETFHGTVRQIRNAPQTVQNVVTYDAVIDVANPGLKLKPGMTANVTFVYAEKDDVLRVPNAALRFRPPPDLPAFSIAPGRPGGRGDGAGGGPPPKAVQTPDQRTLWVVRGDKPAPVRVKTGISDGAFTELLDGALEPGESVVTDASGPPGGMAARLRRPF
ncbi:MAG TPA: efflux RND transporter periplasmic adaptor subunit [Anaeromyxobacteraceae bacterium]|nr:efflux RND transporter periplasmic adaptor subunit [Anaeromyxobacteraceae bacterium]